MEKILITYATRPLGLRIAKLLSASFDVEKATSDDVPSVLRHAYAAIPRGLNPVYAHEILKLALDRSCRYVLPLGKEEIQALAEASVLFGEYDIHLLCPPGTMFGSIDWLESPDSDLPLNLIYNKKDMISGEVFENAPWDGLCMVSDSKDDFVLVVE